MNAVAGQHWLYDWIDEFEISDASSLRARWNNHEARSRFLSILSTARSDFSRVPITGAVIAGTGVNIASQLTCECTRCRTIIADTEYPQILQYSDCVVMAGPPLSQYRQVTSNAKRPSDVLRFLEEDVEVMLYLRKIGLSNYIVFVDDVGHYCENCKHKVAGEMGLEYLLEEERLVEIAKSLSGQGRVEIVQHGPRIWWAGLAHPQFENMAGIILERKTRPRKTDVALKLIHRNIREIMSDAATAMALNAPLASVGKPDFFSTANGHGSLTVDDVALRVRIPVLQGLKTEEFLKLREGEYQHFEAFQVLLQQAVEKTLEEAKTSSPDKAADLVWQKEIRPQVVELQRRIEASSRSIARKAVAAISIGGASAAIGSIAGAVTATIGGTAGTALGVLGTIAVAPVVMPHVAKFLEERQDFEASPVYFLWKAGKASAHQLTI